MLALTGYIKVFTAILVIVNPIGAIPLFISMTVNQPEKARRRTVMVSAFTVGVVLIVACVLGESLLQFFGVSIASFRVGGGILVMLLAISMFQAKLSGSKTTSEEAKEAEEKADVAVVPLAIPLLTGPGAISTVIIFAHQSSDWTHKGLLIASCVLVTIIVWMILRMAIPIGAWLGKTGINIVSRLMGLLLAAIAVEIIADGLSKLLPGLVRG
jgi:multiple antibiotic resistance protein